MPVHTWGTRHFVLLNLQFECPYMWCSVSIAQPHVTTVIMGTLCLIYNTEISVKDLAFYIRVGLYNIALSILQYQEISARFSVLLKENYFLLCFYLQSSGIKSPSTLKIAFSAPEMHGNEWLGIKISESALAKGCC